MSRTKPEPITTHRLTTRRGVRRLAQDDAIVREVERVEAQGVDRFTAWSTAFRAVYRAWKTFEAAYGTRRRQHARANAIKEVRRLMKKQKVFLEDLTAGTNEDLAATLYAEYWSGPPLTPEEALQEEQRRHIIALAVANLPTSERDVIEGFLKGRPFAAMATALGLTERHVRRLFAQGIRRLRHALTPAFHDLT